MRLRFSWKKCLRKKYLQVKEYLKSPKRAAKPLLTVHILDDEKLARHLCGGMKAKSIKKLYNPETKEPNPSQFMDTRNPRELSIDRITTLSLEKAYTLGNTFLKETHKNDPNKLYHGFAQVIAKECRKINCELKPETYEGKKPYHANIHYPAPSKEDEMEYANMLAKVSTLHLSPDAPTLPYHPKEKGAWKNVKN